MVKKFLLSAAVIGALATSAMAYDLNNPNRPSQPNDLLLMKLQTNQEVNASKSHISVIGFNQNQLANTLVFPAYAATNSWSTKIRVYNPTQKEVAAKVVLFDANDSREVADFDIFLSSNDEWIGEIKMNEQGQVVLTSSDGSTALPGGGMASTEHPLTVDLHGVKIGYIEVISMAETTGQGDIWSTHEAFRKAFEDMVHIIRNPQCNGTPITGDNLDDGVVKDASLPDVIPGSCDSDPNHYFEQPGQDLTGDIKIINNTLGQEMSVILPAYKLNYSNDDNVTLAYLPGEKGNVADVFIDDENTSNPYYNYTNLSTVIDNMSGKSVLLPYKTADKNQLLITNPFKRVYIESEFKGDSPNLVNNTGTSADSDNYYMSVKNDGSGVLGLDVHLFNTDENEYGTQSPGNIGTININQEMGFTSQNIGDTNSLGYYINEAENDVNVGYLYTNGGFIRLTNHLNNYNNSHYIPGIVTQWVATDVNGKVLTNWFTPQILSTAN